MSAPSKRLAAAARRRARRAELVDITPEFARAIETQRQTIPAPNRVPTNGALVAFVGGAGCEVLTLEVMPSRSSIEFVIEHWDLDEDGESIIRFGDPIVLRAEAAEGLARALLSVRQHPRAALPAEAP